MSNAFADLLWDDSLAEEELDSAIEMRNSIALAVHPAAADANGAAHSSATAAVPVVKSLMASFRRQLTAQSAAMVASAEADANAAAAGTGAGSPADNDEDAAAEARLAALRHGGQMRGNHRTNTSKYFQCHAFTPRTRNFLVDYQRDLLIYNASRQMRKRWSQSPAF